MFQENEDALSWDKVLELEERPPVSLIEVTSDNNDTTIVASVSWGWKGKEIRLATIEVNEPLRGQNIGNTLMIMLIAIARHYDATKITGRIDGEEFLWNWYQKLGFRIFGENKLEMKL
jgi:predicted GNAT family N-acyltransferase